MLTFILVACDKVKESYKKEVVINTNNKEVVIKRISLDETKEVVENRKSNNIIILDIRTPEEYQMGHIIDSKNIDFYVNFKENIDKLDKDKKYLIYCRHANRTSHALKIMEGLGFKFVYEMDQGVAFWYQKGWELFK
jgi:rhodanese-related sulfurtransferase